MPKVQIHQHRLSPQKLRDVITKTLWGFSNSCEFGVTQPDYLTLEVAPYVGTWHVRYMKIPNTRIIQCAKKVGHDGNSNTINFYYIRSRCNHFNIVRMGVCCPDGTFVSVHQE